MTISGKLTLSLAGAAVIGFCGYAAAQMNSANHPLHTNPGTSSVAPGPHFRATTQPLLPGQDAFGTIQEIVRILERDPTTDWSKVNIAFDRLMRAGAKRIGFIPLAKDLEPSLTGRPGTL
jgi:hypothetical protein